MRSEGGGNQTMDEGGIPELICQKIDDYYERTDAIGESIYRMRDKRSGDIVAVEQLCDTMSAKTVGKIRALNSVPRHASIVEYKEVIKVVGGPVCVAMEYVENDLKGFLMEPSTESKIKSVMKRLLEGVKCLHDNGIMHLDLKPASILVSNDGTQLKIWDLFCGIGIESGRSAGTLSYRAPELLVEAVEAYSSAMDMWSVGCIMAELVSKEVLFDGNGTQDDGSDDDTQIKQLKCIYRNVSAPTNPLRMKFETLLTASGYDLLKRLLELNPCKRIKAADALNHSRFGEDD